MCYEFYGHLFGNYSYRINSHNESYETWNIQNEELTQQNQFMPTCNHAHGRVI